MNRRAFLLMASSACSLVAAPAKADFVDSVRNQLREQGYSRISVSSTMLGRSRIIAKSRTGTREIIMNPRTGEILRDLWSSAQGGSGPSIVGNDDSDDDDDDDDGGKGRGRGSDDDRDDDRDDDKDNDKDKDRDRDNDRDNDGGGDD